jgi:hypothetical protein
MKKTIIFILSAFSGQLSFSQPGTQAFTVSGSYVVPPGITSLTIEVVGAGGTGGGNGGGGGGGGGYAIGVYNVTPGASIPITIGTGGAGAVAGTSSAGMFLSATGGANGTSVPNPNLGGGGAGGVGSGGTIANRNGGAGGGGFWTYFGGGGGGAAGSVSNGTAGGNTIVYVPGACMTPGGPGGPGGGAPGGNGGKGAGFTDNSCNNTNPSAPGASYGGGGGGGNGNGGPAGVGANGYCLVTFSNNCIPPAAPANNTAASNLTLCANGTTTLSALGSGTISWYTTPGGPTPVATGSILVTPALTGNTTYYAEDFTCAGSTTRTAITVSVYALPTISVTTSANNICAGTQVTLTATGAANYTWSPYTPGAMTFSTGPVTAVQPNTSTNYSVIGTDANGCKNTSNITILVNTAPNMTVVPPGSTLCAGQQSTLGLPGAPGSATWTSSNPSSIVFTGNTYIVIQPTVTTTYSVVYNSGGPCPSYGTTTVSVNSLPTISLTVAQVIICRFETGYLVATGGVSYSLTGFPNASTSGIFSISPIVTTQYTVTGVDANGCSNTATVIQLVSTCLGIGEEALLADKLLQVSPNPNKGEFNVEATKEMQLSIVNELGQMVRTLKLNESNHYKGLVKGLAPGVYFISDPSQTVRQKIIVSE